MMVGLEWLVDGDDRRGEEDMGMTTIMMVMDMKVEEMVVLERVKGRGR